MVRPRPRGWAMTGDHGMFASCARRRLAVADIVDGLSEDQLAVESMCSSWDLRTVVGHLVVPLVVGTPRMVLSIVGHGGSFHRANSALARAQAARPVGELTALLRAHATSRFTPPGQGPAAPLTDLCVHTADIRVPLGLGHDIDPAEARTGLELITRSGKFLIPRGRLDGLELAPEDVEGTWGEGRTVVGTAAHLLLAALGRASFLDYLSGPGATLLAERLRA